MAKNPNPIPHIYLITNNINGKIYVGQTNGNEKYYLGGGTRLRKAQKKYGRKNFTKSTLISFPTLNRKELDFWEDFYIELLCCRDRNIGYNANKGGIQGSQFVSDETKTKLKLFQNTPEAKERRLKAQKRAAKARIGMHHTKESKLQSVKTKFGKARIIEIYNSDGSLFDRCDFSLEASVLTGVKVANLRNNLCGLSKSAGGYIFKYKVI